MVFDVCHQNIYIRLVLPLYKDMHPIGKVIRVSKNKSLVLKCAQEQNLKEKAGAYNHDNEKVGVISEIFGPIKKPYVTVKPKKDVDTEKLVGEEVYVK